MVNSGTLPVSGRVAVVIGGTSGIGRELALGLARGARGVNVKANASGVFRTGLNRGFLARGVNQ